MIELVVFDMAGTTVKDERYVDAVFSNILVENKTQLKQKDIDHVMGWPKPVAIRHLLNRGYKGDKEINDDFVSELHDQFVKSMITFYEKGDLVEEIDGASDLFTEIRSHGIKVALDTGFSRAIANVILKRLGWNDRLIDATITSDEVEHGRPEPDMIVKLMDELNVDNPQNVVKVGDTESDILQGKKAKCGMVVGVTSGTFTKEELLKNSPDHIISSIKELPKILW